MKITYCEVCRTRHIKQSAYLFSDGHLYQGLAALAHLDFVGLRFIYTDCLPECPLCQHEVALFHDGPLTKTKV